MNWLQVMVLALALLAAGMGFGNAQNTATTDYRLSVSGNGSIAWVVRSDGRIWYCDYVTFNIDCHVPLNLK
jgi:hypothetical protein